MFTVHASTVRTAKHQRNGQAAFTLVEVACAAFVRLFAIASSIIAMQTGFRSLDYARGLPLASQIVQGEVENFRMLPIELVQSTFESTPNTTFTKVAVGREYTITRTISDPVGASASMRLYDVDFIIEWKGVDGRTHSRRTSTRYSENGLNDYFGSNPKRTL